MLFFADITKGMIEECKRAVAEKACQFVKTGMIVGLGTGSTSAYFIEALAKKGHKIQVVASSKASHKLAEELGLSLMDLNSLNKIDLYVDGADEIDSAKQMIKGAGGALVREKILSHMCKELIVIIDETKIVTELGNRPLPVELIPFGLQSTLHHLNQMGYHGSLRLARNGSFFITDNGNYIFDAKLPSPGKVREDHNRIRSIPGVIDTGYFDSLNSRVIIGFKDGTTVVQ